MKGIVKKDAFLWLVWSIILGLVFMQFPIIPMITNLFSLVSEFELPYLTIYFCVCFCAVFVFPMDFAKKQKIEEPYDGTD